MQKCYSREKFFATDIRYKEQPQLPLTLFCRDGEVHKSIAVHRYLIKFQVWWLHEDVISHKRLLEDKKML